MHNRPIVVRETGRSSAAEDGPLPRDGSRRFVAVALGVYWMTLFIATHVPVPSSTVSMPGADKVAHFVGYGVLGLLLTLCVALCRKLTVRVTLVIVLGLAAYAAVDEWLQIPVGRTCDFVDWVCDLIGGSVGAILIALVSRIQSPRRATRDDRLD